VNTMKLSKPAMLGDAFTTDGASTQEITFREPNGMDMIECGMPWRWESDKITSETSRKMDTTAMAKLIAKLSGLTYAAVNRMTALEFLEAAGIVGGFFQDSGPAARPLSDTLTSPIGGAT
jgi:hypothetical protein